MKRFISLTVTANAGSKIDEIAQEATELAESLCMPIDFNFNDIPCVAFPGEPSTVVVSRWDRALVRLHRASSDKLSRSRVQLPTPCWCPYCGEPHTSGSKRQSQGGD